MNFLSIRVSKLVLGLCLSVIAFDFSAVKAQLSVEEIVVTARKRAESIQDIPLSITAFTSSDMQKKSIQSMTDISLFTPGFNFENAGGYGATRPVIRGATQVAGFNEQIVSFFLDGVYLPRGYITDLGFSNIERVEVVKGPQSARYGRNAFTGAVNYVTKKPSEELTLDGRVTVGNYGRYDYSAAVSGAVIPETLKIRAFIDYEKFDGSRKNSHPFANTDYSGPGTDDRLGGYINTTMGAAIQVTPTENITIDLAYNNYDVDREHQAQNWFGELNADSQLLNCGQFNPDVRPAGSGLGGGGQWNRLFCGELPVRSIPIDPRGYGQQMETDFFRASANWEINDSLTFNYIFGRIEAETKVLGYKDTLPGCTFFVPLCVFENGPIGDFGTSSHEARLTFDNDSRISASGGVYFYESTDFRTNNFGAALPLSAPPTASVDVLDASNFVFLVALGNIATVTKAFSPFAEVNLSLMDDRARLGFEMRYNRDEKDEFNLASGGGTGGLGSFSGAVFSGVFKSWTPRATFEYDLSDDSLVFISAAKGVKSGGFNGTATLEKNRTFDNDQNWTYELGMKNTFNDGRLQLNATLFYIDWTNQQIIAADEGNVNPLSVSIVRNIGDVRSKGIELDTAVALTENLSMYGSAYYGDAAYREGTLDLRWARTPSVCDNVVCNTNGDIGGNQMERQSDFQLTVGGEYAGEFGGSAGLGYYVRGDVAYQAKQYGEAVNLSIVPSRMIANASAGIGGDTYDVQFWVRNLFDEKYVSNVTVQQPNIAYNAYLGQRQTFGVTLSVNY